MKNLGVFFTFKFLLSNEKNLLSLTVNIMLFLTSRLYEKET